MQMRKIIKLEVHEVFGQVYLLPYIKVTHDRTLNGMYELILGWANFGITIRFGKEL